MDYSCIKCKKNFPSKFNLQRHVKTCQEEIPYEEISEILLSNQKEINKLKKELQKNTENKKIEKETKKLTDIIKEKDIIIKEKDNIIQNLNELQNVTHNIDCDLHDTLIDLNDGHSGVYLAFVSDTIVKFGRTNTMRRRACDHLKDFGQQPQVA